MDIEVKVTAGTPIKQVILQEIVAYKTTWVIFDRWVSFASFSLPFHNGYGLALKLCYT